MEVCRVKHHLTRVGPFVKAEHRHISDGMNLTIHKQEYNGMPPPDKDGIGLAFLIFDQPKFAFPSMSVFVDFWRYKTLQELGELGFVLVIKDIPDNELLIGKSGLQCVYDGYLPYRTVATMELVDAYMENFAMVAYGED